MQMDAARLEQLLGKMTLAERREFLALLEAEKKEPSFKDEAFKAQTAFLEDPARLKVVLCTRRSGKSYGAGLMLMKEAWETPNVSCLYVALTRASAKRIMWKDVLKAIDRQEGLGCRFNETELSVTLKNGSVIYLLGMDADEGEKEKALGQKFKAVVVDEAASYSVDLNEMVYGILKPATADYRGVIALIGTPGNLKRGLFYELTRGQDPGSPGRWERQGWSGHRWSAFDNPHMADKWKAEIEDLKLANPLVEQTAQFQQHYLGKWLVDDSKLVYRFDFGRNTFEELPVFTKGGKWHYVLGIDLGFNDPTAWVVCAYHDFDRTLYVLGAHKKEFCDITEVAAQTKRLMQRFEFDRIVIDNANKQAVEEMRRRHDLPLTAAEKAGKSDFIELMNADFVQERVKLHSKAALPLIEEYANLVWDERGPRREEHPAAPNHCCFVAGTRVWTRRGEVPIETVTDADEVLTHAGWCQVDWCAKTGEKEVLRVEFSDGRELIGTPEHPIWTETRGWVRLDSLTATDLLVTVSDLNAELAEYAVERVTPAGTAHVWALRVSGTPEYFANGVLVHNCDSALYAWRYCYQYLAEVPAQVGPRGADEEARWMMMYEEEQMQKLLEDKRVQDAEYADWSDPV